MVEFPLPSCLLCGNSECLLLKFTFFLLYKQQRKVEGPPPETWVTEMEVDTPEGQSDHQYVEVMTTSPAAAAVYSLSHV